MWLKGPSSGTSARRVEDSTLETKVAFAINPGWVGTTEVRKLEMTGDGHLILRLTRAWPDGRVMSGWVRWRRASA